MKLLVRLREDAMQHVKGHPHKAHPYTKGKRESLPTRTPLIELGPARTPDGGWLCGTDVVWPVLWVEGIGKIPRAPCGGMPFVCRHQIEAGD